jgi:hypothetical protein
MLAGVAASTARRLPRRLPDLRQRERLGASSTRPCTAFREGAQTALAPIPLSSLSMARLMVQLQLEGAYAYGTVFTMTTSGKETTLHSFGGSDGVGPDGTLVNVKGTFYATTVGGGDSGSCGSSSYCGTVFSMTPSGKEPCCTTSPGAHGGEPQANLVDVKGTLYSTTLLGGANGVGTVFAVTTSRAEPTAQRRMTS